MARPAREFQRPQSSDSVQRKHSVAERGDLLILRQLVGIGDPPSRQTHEPFDERGCWAGAVGVVQEGWRGC